MPSRRSFLTGTVATGVTLSMQHAAATVAQQKRVIVDSQVHLWPASTPERPWLPGAQPQLPEPFTIERIIPLMDEAGVDRVVIVPPASLEGERVDYAQEAVKRYPGRFAIMARVALDKPDRAARLATWRDQPGVLGVRSRSASHVKSSTFFRSCSVSVLSSELSSASTLPAKSGALGSIVLRRPA